MYSINQKLINVALNPCSAVAFIHLLSFENDAPSFSRSINSLLFLGVGGSSILEGGLCKGCAEVLTAEIDGHGSFEKYGWKRGQA